METDKNINRHIERILNATDSIEPVHVSPFFKERTLNRWLSETKAPMRQQSWFTPQWQLATLICFFALNIYAFMQINEEDTTEKISDFGETSVLGVAEDSDMVYLFE